MAQYIPFSDEQKLRANEVDLEEFLRQRGEKLISSGREKRMESDHSVTIRGNEWYDHAMDKGGGPVSFVRERYGVTYPEAVSMLLGGNDGKAFPMVKPKEAEEQKLFVVPKPNENMSRVYAYLMKVRGIDKSVISYFARAGTLYEDERYHNCVFLGRDESGKARHAHKRSTNSEGKAFKINVEGSDPRYSFNHIGTNGSLYVFEAPIDMLSYITLHPKNWDESSYVACCGTSSLPVLKMIERLGYVEKVALCLDNDSAGNMASERMRKLLSESGIESERLAPINKDWNDDLRMGKEQKQCITMSFC